MAKNFHKGEKLALWPLLPNCSHSTSAWPVSVGSQDYTTRSINKSSCTRRTLFGQACRQGAGRTLACNTAAAQHSRYHPGCTAICLLRPLRQEQPFVQVRRAFRQRKPQKTNETSPTNLQRSNQQQPPHPRSPGLTSGKSWEVGGFGVYECEILGGFGKLGGVRS